MFLGYTVDILSAFFLICFGIGLVTSIGALILGADGDTNTHSGDILHGSGSSELMHGVLSGDLSHAGTAGTSHGAGAHADGTHGNAHAQGAEHVSILNLNTLLGFLLGFGATGFVLKQEITGIPLLINLLFAFLGGAVFAYIVYLVLAKILIRGQSAYLNASDFNLVGVEAKVSSTIFANRVGEVSYVLNRSYAAIPAKERDGREIKKGQPVIIVEVSNGLAIVLLREEFIQHGL